VIAGAHRDHAAAALGGGERRELVQRAALLERGGELQVLELEEDFRAGEPGARRAAAARMSAIETAAVATVGMAKFTCCRALATSD
jgi:hypothetical protein